MGLGVKVEIRVDNFREVGIEFAERTTWDAERVIVPIRRPNMACVRIGGKSDYPNRVLSEVYTNDSYLRTEYVCDNESGGGALDYFGKC